MVRESEYLKIIKKKRDWATKDGAYVTIRTEILIQIVTVFFKKKVELFADPPDTVNKFNNLVKHFEKRDRLGVQRKTLKREKSEYL